MPELVLSVPVAEVRIRVTATPFVVLADTNSDVVEWQTQPRDIWFIENECHLQIEGTHITFTNKAKYNRLSDTLKIKADANLRPESPHSMQKMSGPSPSEVLVEFSCFIRYPNSLHD